MMADGDGERIKVSRGHPRVYNEKLTNATLLKHKNAILTKNDSGENALVTSDNKIWKTIALELEQKTETGKPTRKPQALYVYACCNKTFRKQLDPTFISEPIIDDTEDSEGEEVTETSAWEDTLNFSINYDYEFKISEAADDYLAFIEERETGQKTRRTRRKCVPDAYQDFIHDRCWQNERSRHGFRFHWHTIDATFSGQFHGDCACGSELDVIIEVEDGVMTMNCKATKGSPSEPCSIRPVRGPKRRDWGEKLLVTRPKAFQAALAGKMMDVGDPWPALIPTKAVLRTIRHEAVSREYRHKEPLRALELLHEEKMKDQITLINSNPVMICYSTGGQQQLYRSLAEKGGLSLAIDSSGSINQPVIRPDSSQSGAIFLYHAVVRSENYQISLAQMLSEQHNTRAILLWLNSFTKSLKLPAPAEVVTDGATALQCACIRAFTPYSTTNDYVNSFLTSEVAPSCWIRGDAAHFLKTYVKLLKNERTEVARYYKLGIGQLIICCDLEKAKVIIRSLLTTSQSKYIGPNVDNTDSEAHRQRNVLTDLLTSATDTLDCDDLDEDDEAANNDKAPYDPCSDGSSPNLWAKMVSQINDSVNSKIASQPGIEPSAYYLPKFAKKFLVDIEKLPLWSCIYRNRFSAGRIPASSSSAENEFYQTKHILLHNMPKIRVDRFIEIQSEYYDNLIKLHNAEMMRPKRRIESDEDSSVPRGFNVGDEKLTRTNSHESGRNSEDECPMCANGDFPTGAHKCICGKAVHTHDKCSQRIGDEEGYGVKRRCFPCARKHMSKNGNPFSNDKASSGTSEEQTTNTSNIPSSLNRNLKPPEETHGNFNASCSEDDAETILEHNGFCPVGSDSPRDRTSGSPIPDTSSTDSNGIDPKNESSILSPRGRAGKRKYPFRVDKSTSQIPIYAEASSNSATGYNKRSKKSRISKLSEKLDVDDAASLAEGLNPGEGNANITEEDIRIDRSSESNAHMEASGVRLNMGKTLPQDKHRGFHFGECYPAHMFEFTDSLSKIPIIKSGDDPTLQAVRKSGIKYNLQSTDSFDSLYYLMMATSSDSPLFRERVIDQYEVENKFFKFIHKVLTTKQPSSGMYGDRLEILLEYFHHKLSGHPNLKCMIMDCESSISDICERIFSKIPTVITSYSCDNGCEINQKQNPLLSIHWEDFIGSKPPGVLESSVIGHDIRSECQKEGCSGCVTSKVTIPMAFLLLAIRVDESKSQVSLKKVPETIQLPMMSMKYQLRGVVAYQAPGITNARQAKSINAKGFNIAYCFRNRRWFHYRKKSSPCKEIPEVCARLIAYSV